MNTAELLGEFGETDHRWAWQKWTRFAEWPEKEKTIVIVPLCGFAQWHPEAPLDLEEQILTQVLDKTLREKPADRFLVVPMIRFVLGPIRTCAFPINPDLCHAQIEGICISVKSAGFRKIVLFNSSPWNEELCDVAARDLRIEQCIQMFCVNLSGLGIALEDMSSASRPPWVASSTEQESNIAQSLAEAAHQFGVLLDEIDAWKPLRPLKKEITP